MYRCNGRTTQRAHDMTLIQLRLMTLHRRWGDLYKRYVPTRLFPLAVWFNDGAILNGQFLIVITKPFLHSTVTKTIYIPHSFVFFVRKPRPLRKVTLICNIITEIKATTKCISNYVTKKIFNFIITCDLDFQLHRTFHSCSFRFFTIL